VLVRVTAGRAVVVGGVVAPATARRHGPEWASAETEWLPPGPTGLASSF
jgi:hypothetical protein